MSKPSAKCRLCPVCGSTDRNVLQSRRGPHGIHRRSQCRNCGARYSTNEYCVAEQDPNTTILLVRMRDRLSELEESLNALQGIPMKYVQTKPCADCPFLESNAKSYGLRRLAEFASGNFPCHKTAKLIEDEDSSVSEFHATKDSVACAGALIFCEKRNAPNQMMRIAERLGMYDHTVLDMTAPVI